jgi:hypothetical protein
MLHDQKSLALRSTLYPKSTTVKLLSLQTVFLGSCERANVSLQTTEVGILPSNFKHVLEIHKAVFRCI